MSKLMDLAEKLLEKLLETPSNPNVNSGDPRNFSDTATVRGSVSRVEKRSRRSDGNVFYNVSLLHQGPARAALDEDGEQYSNERGPFLQKATTFLSYSIQHTNVIPGDYVEVTGRLTQSPSSKEGESRWFINLVDVVHEEILYAQPRKEESSSPTEKKSNLPSSKKVGNLPTKPSTSPTSPTDNSPQSTEEEPI